MTGLKKTTCLYFAGFLMLALYVSTAPVQAQTEDNSSSEPLLAIENNTVALPLESVLVLALKNNLDITFASLQPDSAATEITREKSKYDTLFTSQYYKYRQKTQVASALSGSSSSAEIYREQFTVEATLQKKFTLGTLAELKLTHNDATNDLPFSGLVPQYDGELNLSLTQPLLRDFGLEIGRSLIKIASLNHQISEKQFKQQVMDILYQVESIYWDLYFRVSDLASKKKSLKRAEDLQREFRIRIEAGTLAPIEIYQADAEVALRTQEVIVADARVRSAEDNLKAALNLYENEKYWSISILPTEQPVKSAIQPVLTECISTALEKRPDFAQAKLNLEAKNIQVKYSKNQMLPRVDLFGSIATTGLAGRPHDTSGAFGVFFRSKPSPWKGHWDDVYDRMASGDYYNYTVGIKLEVPFENRLAKSQHARSKVEAAQAITSLKTAENNIINEVRDAVRMIETSRKVIDTATASLKLAQEKLKAEEKKYKVGMSTTHDVLEFQAELSMSESNLASAYAEHRKSLANLMRVMGILLEEKGLVL